MLNNTRSTFENKMIPYFAFTTIVCIWGSCSYISYNLMVDEEKNLLEAAIFPIISLLSGICLLIIFAAICFVFYSWVNLGVSCLSKIGTDEEWDIFELLWFVSIISELFEDD